MLPQSKGKKPKLNCNAKKIHIKHSESKFAYKL